MYVRIIIINFISLFLLFNLTYSKDSLITADHLETDENRNVYAEGNVKIIYGDEIMRSEILYVDEINDKVILDKDFQYKDKDGNYYFGSKATFSKDFKEGIIEDFSYFGSDKLRLRGTRAQKIGNIDIVDKATITPCKTIKFLGCPLWQTKASTLIHDKEELLIYQKNSRLEFLNVPVLYTPYSITPSPLRKTRKSGFLYPTFYPFRTSGGSMTLPYYINVSHDKELLITPSIYYIQKTQSVDYDYAQITPGGTIKIRGHTSTDFETSESAEIGDQLVDAKLTLDIKKNINRNFQTGLNLNVATSGSYIRNYDPTDKLNVFSSLTTSAYVDGYSVWDEKDLLTIETYNFQAAKKNTDQKKIPIVAPVVDYNTGNKLLYDKISLQNSFLFYNIYRDIKTDDHGIRQTRLNYDANISYQDFWKNSRIRFESIVQTDFYSTFKKQINNDYVSDEHYRIFPMTGLLIDNPFISKNDTIFNPSIFLSINGSNNNTNEISNELTTDNEFDLSRFFSVNRYTGNDKFDNGQRLGYGLNIKKENFDFNIAQGYQISDHSDYNKDVNMISDFTDILGDFSISRMQKTISEEESDLLQKLDFKYDYRYSASDKYIYYQNASLDGVTKDINWGLRYHNSDDKASSLSFGERENINLYLSGFQPNDNSSMQFQTSYDLIEDKHQTSTISYSYGDECFALGATYNRNFFEDTPDTLAISMSMTFIGPVPQGLIDDLILVPFNFKEESGKAY